MGKKKINSGLGKSVIKDRFGTKNRQTADSFLHTSELNDGYEWGRLNLQSVTEQSTLEDFLTTAQMAGTEFQAEKLNVTLVSAERHTGLLTHDEEVKVKETQEKHKTLLNIPRRPFWDESTTADELDMKERQSFLEWRRNLAQLQDVEGLVLTPFEKNLDFWRQLWRVIERSDIVVQIVDARNPLLFYCEDLDTYVQEVSERKMNVLLINKADYLTAQQRTYWAQYFTERNIKVIFWSATDENERNKERDKEFEETESNNDFGDSSDEEETSDECEECEDSIEDEDDSGEKKDLPEKEQMDLDDSCHTPITDNSAPCNVLMDGAASSSNASTNIREDISEKVANNESEKLPTSNVGMACSSLNACSSDKDNTSETVIDNLKKVCFKEDSEKSAVVAEKSNTVSNSAEMLTGEELIDILKVLHVGIKYQEGITTIGLVGYPNVGKSSTINALLRTKKVPVSATPGRTKHFQTLFVEPTVMLCDCPGLVMPTFVSTKADMVVSGILPIDQMRDYVPPTSLVCKLIPRVLLENTYGLLLPKPNVDDGEDADRLPTAYELLGTYGRLRGFMTHKGNPDFPRSARFILKDYVNGKLLYCHAPPNIDTEEFCTTPLLPKVVKVAAEVSTTAPKGIKNPTYTSSVDKAFFTKAGPRAGSKGVGGGLGYIRTDNYTEHQTSQKEERLSAKPWKKHHNRGKKEKLRRLHGHLDVN